MQSSARKIEKMFHPIDAGRSLMADRAFASVCHAAQYLPTLLKSLFLPSSRQSEWLMARVLACSLTLTWNSRKELEKDAGDV